MLMISKIVEDMLHIPHTDRESIVSRWTVCVIRLVGCENMIVREEPCHSYLIHTNFHTYYNTSYNNMFVNIKWVMKIRQLYVNGKLVSEESITTTQCAHSAL